MSSDEEAPAQGEPAPDMTGVVDSSFNSKEVEPARTGKCRRLPLISTSVLTPCRGSGLLSKARTADQIRIDKLSSDNEAMRLS